MGTLRDGPAVIKRVADFGCLLQQRPQDAIGQADLKGSGSLVELEFVQVGDGVDVKPSLAGEPVIDAALLDVGFQRAAQAGPQPVKVDEGLTRGFVGVLAQQVGVVQADGALADRLDLNQRATPGQVSIGRAADGQVIGPQRDLCVLDGA